MPGNAQRAIPIGAYPRYSGVGGQDAHNEQTRLRLRYDPFGGNFSYLENAPMALETTSLARG